LYSSYNIVYALFGSNGVDFTSLDLHPEGFFITEENSLFFFMDGLTIFLVLAARKFAEVYK